MYFKKVAIINDNPIMLGNFLKILNEQNFSREFFNFFCTPTTSKEIYFDLRINITHIDLKFEYHKLIGEGFDLLISMHCKQIFPSELVNRIKCINIHPGYNPYNRGWYPQVFAILNKLEVGATIHEIDDFVDHGNIIDRKKVVYHSWDTSYTIYKRILDVEVELLRKNLFKILNNTYTTTIPEGEGYYFSRNDFKKACEIDLQEKGDFKSFLDRLRALSHGDYKNAWYLDSESGKKVYVSINLKLDDQ